jgi:hypothetical protein
MKVISQICAVTYLLFALRDDGTLWVCDGTVVPLDWSALPYGGTGEPIYITNVCYPGPMGQNTLFVLSNDDTLWSYTWETGEWLKRVYVPQT